MWKRCVSTNHTELGQWIYKFKTAEPDFPFTELSDAQGSVMEWKSHLETHYFFLVFNQFLTCPKYYLLCVLTYEVIAKKR